MINNFNQTKLKKMYMNNFLFFVQGKFKKKIFLKTLCQIPLSLLLFKFKIMKNVWCIVCHFAILMMFLKTIITFSTIFSVKVVFIFRGKKIIHGAIFGFQPCFNCLTKYHLIILWFYYFPCRFSWCIISILLH